MICLLHLHLIVLTIYNLQILRNASAAKSSRLHFSDYFLERFRGFPVKIHSAVRKSRKRWCGSASSITLHIGRKEEQGRVLAEIPDMQRIPLTRFFHSPGIKIPLRANSLILQCPLLRITVKPSAGETFKLLISRIATEGLFRRLSSDFLLFLCTY